MRDDAARADKCMDRRASPLSPSSASVRTVVWLLQCRRREPFGSRKSRHPFFDYGIYPVPSFTSLLGQERLDGTHRVRQHNVLVLVRDAEHALSLARVARDGLLAQPGAVRVVGVAGLVEVHGPRGDKEAPARLGHREGAHDGGCDLISADARRRLCAQLGLGVRARHVGQEEGCVSTPRGGRTVRALEAALARRIAERLAENLVSVYVTKLTSAQSRAMPSNARGFSKNCQNARSATALLAIYLMNGWVAAPCAAQIAGASSFHAPVSRAASRLTVLRERNAALGPVRVGHGRKGAGLAHPEGAYLICTTRCTVDVAQDARRLIVPFLAGRMTRSGSPVFVTSRGEAACTTPATPLTATSYAPGYSQWVRKGAYGRAVGHDGDVDAERVGQVRGLDFVTGGAAHSEAGREKRLDDVSLLARSRGTYGPRKPEAPVTRMRAGGVRAGMLVIGEDESREVSRDWEYMYACEQDGVNISRRRVSFIDASPRQTPARGTRRLSCRGSG
ncbi:unnamed protein product [Cutaneotrichosporon oleaginosum]